MNQIAEVFKRVTGKEKVTGNLAALSPPSQYAQGQTLLLRRGSELEVEPPPGREPAGWVPLGSRPAGGEGTVFPPARRGQNIPQEENASRPQPQEACTSGQRMTDGHG